MPIFTELSSRPTQSTIGDVRCEIKINVPSDYIFFLQLTSLSRDGGFRPKIAKKNANRCQKRLKIWKCKATKNRKKVQRKCQKLNKKGGFHWTNANIRTHQDIQCFPYQGFFSSSLCDWRWAHFGRRGESYSTKSFRAGTLMNL